MDYELLAPSTTDRDPSNPMFAISSLRMNYAQTNGLLFPMGKDVIGLKIF